MSEMVKLSLNVRETQGHHLYLGLPTFTLRSKRTQFGYLRDRLLKKVDTRQKMHFSEGGKEVLIKAVLQAIPTYTMTCFRIPTSICNDLERQCARFWWGTSDVGKKIHWKNWDFMYMPKEWGGMGFRKMVWFNKALLAKQVWRMISEPESLLTRVYKAQYFKHGDIMDANLGSNPSYI
ncbi:hypothetical protein ACS0TY_016649 [Phlomoides rotata]